MSPKLRRAVIGYCVVVAVVLLIAWGIAIWGDWRAGMAILSVAFLQCVYQGMKAIIERP